jgi:hypothetical protein
MKEKQTQTGEDFFSKFLLMVVPWWRPEELIFVKTI